MIYTQKPLIKFFERIVGEVHEVNKDVESPCQLKITGCTEINHRHAYLRTGKELYWTNYDVSFNRHETISATVKELEQISEINCGLTFEIERDVKELFSVLMNHILKVSALKRKKCFIVKYRKDDFSGEQKELLIEEVLKEFNFNTSTYDDQNNAAVKFIEFSHIPMAVNLSAKNIWYGDMLGMDYYITKDNSDPRTYLYKFILGKVLLSGQISRANQSTITLSELNMKEDNPGYIIKMCEHIMLEYMQEGVTVFNVAKRHKYASTTSEAMRLMGFTPDGQYYSLTVNP